MLFPALYRSDPEVGGAMARRLTKGATGLRQLAEAIQKMVRSPPAAASRRALLGRYLTLYADLLRARLRTEEDELFPLIASQLGPEERARIALEFRRIEAEEVDPQRLKRYRRCVRELYEIYVP